MKLTHIHNACCIYESDGFKLLADPWLTPGAFEGSWHMYPPLRTSVVDLINSDALYISHLHPDHYDETVLKEFVAYNKQIPVLVLDHGANFLHKKLTDLGFTNLIKVKDKETVRIGPMEVTLYAPFTKHPFDHSSLGNFIDSALVIQVGEQVILNANDNTPTEEAAKELRKTHGKFSVTQLKDSLAGAYPSCFLNLTPQGKTFEAQRLIIRQLTAMCQIASILETDWFQPFAGDYQLGGKLSKKNQFLGVAGKQHSALFIAGYGLRPLILNEGGSIDLTSGELKATYHKNIESYESWTDRVSQIKYSYEFDSEVLFEDLLPKLIEARKNLQRFQDRFNYYPAIKVYVNDFCFDMNYSGPNKVIKFIMDNRILNRILNKTGHWNNFEVGCHIDIERLPNEYDPDLVNAMCFFHC